MATASKQVAMDVHEPELVWRYSLLELPMNEPYMPDGKTKNPSYDPDYCYGWGAYNDPNDVATKRASGYTFVTFEELGDRLPPHYQSALREEGQVLVFGDLVMMKISRARRRQMKEAQEAFSKQVLKTAGRSHLNELGDAEAAPSHIKNEVVLRD